MNDDRKLTPDVLDELDELNEEFVEAEERWENEEMSDDRWDKIRAHFEDRLSWYATDLLAAARRGMDA